MTRLSRTAATLAALSLLPLLGARPSCAQQALTPVQIAPDLAFTEAVARHPLSAGEKAQVTAIDQAQFQRDPAWTLKALRGEAVELARVRRFDAVRLADWRKTHLVGTYFYSGPMLTPDQVKTLAAIYTRTNPIVDADPATKTIVTEKDVEAWVAATRLLSSQIGVSVPIVRAHVTAIAHQRTLGDLRYKAAWMERNWAAYQLCWAHEPASDRRLLLGKVARLARHDAAQSVQKGATMTTALALVVAANAAADYPAALNPKFAATKARMRANDTMAGTLMTLGWINSAIGHSISGGGFPGPFDP